MTTIDAGTAKLAGLQIDMLQKIRSGQITVAHLEWFNNLNLPQRNMLSGADLSKLVDSRFKFLKSFEVIVQEGYNHATRLDTFHAAHQNEENKEFYFYNDAITDVNYAPIATTKLTPGRKFMVKVFGIIDRVSSVDCLTKIKTEKGTLVGAQGASLAYEQKKEQLPKGKWALSFDEKEALWRDPDGSHRVPSVGARTGGDFYFDLAHFENDWDSDVVLLCFCDLSEVEHSDA